MISKQLVTVLRRYLHGLMTVVLLFSLFSVADAFAATCTSQTSGNWNVAGRWNCGHVPTGTDSVVVANGTTVTLNVDSTIQQITVNGTLNTDNNGRTLTLTQTPTGSILFTLGASGTFTAGNSTVTMTANSSETLTSGAITFNNLELSPTLTNDRTYDFGTGAITVSGDFTINPEKSGGSTRTLTVNMNAAITVVGTTTIMAAGSNALAELDTGSNRALTTGRLNIGTRGTLLANASTITLNGATGPLFTRTGTFTQGTSTVVMNSPASVNLNSGTVTFSNLTINMPGQTGSLANDITVQNTLTLSAGTLAVGANTLTLSGPAIAGTPANLSTIAASSLAFDGTSGGVSIPSNVTSLTNLSVGNVRGVTMNSAITVSGTLNLASGALTTNGNALTSTGNCTSAVTWASGYVVGSLTLTFPASAGMCTFPVGGGAVPAHIEVTKPLTPSGGTLTGSTTGAEHPDIATSAIDPTKDANRHWTLTGDTINASSYEVTLKFVAGDVDSGATTANFVVGRYNGTSWTLPTPVTTSATSTGSANVAGPLNNVTFAVGESTFVCSVPAGMPSTMTCVCENFGRAFLNPSTIYGGNWTLSHSSGSFGDPKIVNPGYLRMTDNSLNVATAATMPGTFPAAGNLITVEFKHYAYNGTGADGIALTLSDSTMTPTPGAYGGSLGYAQKDNASCASPPCNGFIGGWVGIGIDEFGNYSNPTEGRNGGPGLRLDSVAVRGSGSDLTGYPYMGGTGTLSPGIDNAASPPSTPAYGHAYRIMVDARCYERNTANADITCNNPSLTKRTQVTVNRDTSGAGTFTAANQVITFDAYQANPSQANVPANWKLSFTGSTGGNTNVHEIQGLKICAQTITPPAGYRIQVDNLTPSTCATPGGNPNSPIVTVTALDTNGNVVANYNKTISLSAKLANGSTSAATWRKVGATSNLVGNQYTFVLADNGVAQFYLTDASPQTVYISVSEVGGTISSSLGTPVVYSGASFNISNIDSLGGQVGGGVVAGRPHLMRITRTNGCSVDTTYNGIKNLDGWYTPATSDHPVGALAPQICATNGGSCLPSTGACQTLSIAPPTVDSSSNFMPPLTFASGVADFCLKTTDVGKYSISLRDDSAASVIGSSATLTARPFAIAVTDIKAGTTNNPGAASPDANSAIFTDAGLNFQATVGGYLWNSAGDVNGDGLPDTASRNAITGAGVAPHFAGTVDLKAADPFYPSTPPLTEQGTLTNGGVAITGGSHTQLTLGFSEVGSFTLSATPENNYLRSGVDLANRVAIFANPALSTQNAVVGRFKPNRFTLDGPLTGAAITNRSELTCTPSSPFTYMGEPIGVRFRLNALNANGDVTKKYTGTYAKLTNTTDWLTVGSNNTVGLWMTALGYPVGTGSCRVIFSTGTTTTFDCTTGVMAPAPVTRAAGPRVTVVTGTPVISWTSGVGEFSANATLERADVPLTGTPDGPYNTLHIGVDPRDSDGVALASLNLDTDTTAGNDRYSVGTTAVRFGRLRLLNALGSDKLNLPIPIRTEYWTGTSFITNTDDNCTSISASNVSLTNYQGGITATTLPGTNIVAGGAFTGGVGSLVLNKPICATTCTKGSVNVCVDLGADTTTPPTCTATTSANMPWLQGRWSAVPAQPNYDDDPNIRATFGVYRGAPVIYIREMY